MIVAFLGPSLAVKPRRGLRVLPPARQGDVWRALELRPRAIALVDGVFESRPSVWHQEILDALDSGVAVFGGASMGALRAAELHTYGMVGVGQIFRWYRDGALIDDADVALLHGDAEHRFRPLTVPQVNVRWAARKLLPAAQSRGVEEASARIFYQERTWPRVLELVPRRLHRRFTSLDLKAQDAREVLRAALAFRGGRPVRPRQPPESSLVRRRRLPALQPLADARALADAGLRRSLLAGWARELGLRNPGTRYAIPHANPPLRGFAPDEAARLAEDLALERLMLDHAERILNDGPSAEEALATEVRLRAARRRR